MRCGYTLKLLRKDVKVVFKGKSSSGLIVESDELVVNEEVVLKIINNGPEDCTVYRYDFLGIIMVEADVE